MQKIQLQFGFPAKMNKKPKQIEKLASEKKDNFSRNGSYFGQNIGDRESDTLLNRLKKCL